MPQNIVLSVVIPTYNDGWKLVEAVHSANSCVLDEMAAEVVIVNDGSDDPESFAALEALKQQSYLIFDQPNSGVSAASNRTIELARGEFILPLGGDDVLTGRFVGEAISLLKSDTRLGVVYGNYHQTAMVSDLMKPGAFNPDLFLFGLQGVPATSVFRRALWSSIEGYDEELHMAVDYEFWIRAYSRGWGFRYHPELLFEYRRRPDSVSAGLLDPGTLARTAEYILDKNALIYLNRMDWLIDQFTTGSERAPTVNRKAYLDGITLFIQRVSSIGSDKTNVQSIIERSVRLQSILQDNRHL